MKRVLIIATVQSHVAQFHKPLIDELRQANIEVDIAAKYNLDVKDNLRIDNVNNIFDVNFSRNPFSLNNIEAYKQLKIILSSNHYDIIHCNTPMGGVLGRLAGAKYRKNGTQIFYTAHGFHFYKGASIKSWILYYPIEKILSKYTDKLITINQEDYNLALKKFKKTTVVKIHGVGVDERKFRIKEHKNLVKKIICIGELNDNKNQIQLLKAAKYLKEKNYNFVIMLAGNGEKEQELKKFVELNQLEKNIEFLGYVSNIDEYISRADIGVSMSKREGLPLNVVEVCLSGIPFICTINRGHKELINKNNGFLVKVGDIEGTAKIIEQYLFNYNNLDKQGIRHSVMDYSKTNVINELKKIYEL